MVVAGCLDMSKKKRKNPDFDLFYLEIPKTDYLKDIEIQDEYEPNDNGSWGLSEQQVSEIARDSLEAAKRSQPKKPQSRQPDEK